MAEISLHDTQVDKMYEQQQRKAVRNGSWRYERVGIAASTSVDRISAVAFIQPSFDHVLPDAIFLQLWNPKVVSI
jgi:hypothetical protein